MINRKGFHICIVNSARKKQPAFTSSNLSNDDSKSNNNTEKPLEVNSTPLEEEKIKTNVDEQITSPSSTNESSTTTPPTTSTTTTPPPITESNIGETQQQQPIVTNPTSQIRDPVPPAVVNPEHHFYTQKIRNLANELDMMLKRRGYSTFRVLVTTSLGLAVFIFLFSEDIKNFFSQHGADVASRSLGSESVQMSAEVLSKAVVQQVLSDAKTTEHAVNFLKDLISRKETQQLLVTLLLQVLQDPITQEYVSQFAKERIALYLLRDEYTIQVASEFAWKIIDKPETKDHLVILLNNALKDEAFRQHVADLFASVILYDVVKQSGSELGMHTVHNVMDDQNVQQHAEVFVTGILSNQKVRHDAGFALWEALKVSLTPTWFYHPPPNAPEQTSEQPAPEGEKPTEEKKPEEKPEEQAAITASTEQPAALESSEIKQPLQITQTTLPSSNPVIPDVIGITSLDNSGASTKKKSTSTEIAVVNNSK
ncbi:hypothetical protein NAEGRDRAFT_78700 [Naegleria gruberi]|uniref:Uncharacterized protein n=1 Tax=Naegleria gruberi TaxID=5762 RepID=D2V5U1_NAEGR|nr:uncharacterized protein NAEGRDRAFT_78700 [Naegleria gruberi]EFC47853.1 hypothetical protein NAEGRDRAFT_78700 [Naegleria gruberi]|eukprot:XP_002680597.1 hypothetical protein NAEGRDRAFT_78700 [Naegleria gruberi strain NEG-M]